MNISKYQILSRLVLAPRTMELELTENQQGSIPHYIRKAEIITWYKPREKKRKRRSFLKVPLKYLC